MKRHAQVERAKSVAVLKTRLKTALKELANALAENGRYKIKLETRRSLEKNIVHQQYFSQNANEALSVSLGREMLAESRLKWLRRQNASLKLELAQLMLLKDDFHKLKEALCVAELRCDETYVSSLLKVVVTQASPRLQDTKLLHMRLPGIFRDKVIMPESRLTGTCKICIAGQVVAEAPISSSITHLKNRQSGRSGAVVTCQTCEIKRQVWHHTRYSCRLCL